MLIGIHSSGIKCGDNAPAWYVRVSLATFSPYLIIQYLSYEKIATAFQISRVKRWIECILDLASKGTAAGSVEFFCAQFAKPNGNYVPFSEDYRG